MHYYNTHSRLAEYGTGSAISQPEHGELSAALAQFDFCLPGIWAATHHTSIPRNQSVQGIRRYMWLVTIRHHLHLCILGTFLLASPETRIASEILLFFNGTPNKSRRRMFCRMTKYVENLPKLALQKCKTHCQKRSRSCICMFVTRRVAHLSEWATPWCFVINVQKANEKNSSCCITQIWMGPSTAQLPED